MFGYREVKCGRLRFKTERGERKRRVKDEGCEPLDEKRVRFWEWPSVYCGCDADRWIRARVILEWGPPGFDELVQILLILIRVRVSSKKKNAC